ncbi:hypothetical protein AYI68_g4902, partial [Smittium mucronatum]
MKVKVLGLTVILMGLSVDSVAKKEINYVNGGRTNPIFKELLGFKGEKNGEWNGGRRYYRDGRYWDWYSNSDDAFLAWIRYRPNVYYGQRFQFLYMYQPEFKRLWNTDAYFRWAWDSDLHFRNSLFSTVYPYGYSEYRPGGKYYGYHNWIFGNGNHFGGLSSSGGPEGGVGSVGGGSVGGAGGFGGSEGGVGG